MPPPQALPPLGRLLPAKAPNRAVIYSSLVWVGIGVGWLVGLSVTPVVSTVISAITAATATVVAAMSGFEGKPQWSVSPIPTALLVAGIVLGSTLGMKARNEDWWGQDMEREAQAWIQAGLPLEKEVIVQRLFESQYPSTGGASAPPAPRTTGLFGISTDECARMRGLSDNDLRREVRLLSDTRTSRLADIVSSPEELKEIVEVLCAASP